MKTHRATFVLVCLSLTLSLLAGCAGTQQARKVDRSGFLGTDFKKLEDTNEPNLPLKFYKKPGLNLAGYDELIIDPVTVWRDKQTEGVSAGDRQRLANNFYAMINVELGKEMKIVSTPGPGTLRLSVAMTRLDSSNVTLDTVSSVVPQMRAVTSLSGYATGKPAFTGQAAVAFKVTDSETGELLVAGADRRVGGKQIAGSTDSWSDVNEALKYWATNGRYNICRWRGKSNCPKPDKSKGV